jgi:hypothetical protein
MYCKENWMSKELLDSQKVEIPGKTNEVEEGKGKVRKNVYCRCQGGIKKGSSDILS